jgi:hypothetical protein
LVVGPGDVVLGIGAWLKPVSHHDGGACRCLRLCFEHV